MTSDPALAWIPEASSLGWSWSSIRPALVSFLAKTGPGRGLGCDGGLSGSLGHVGAAGEELTSSIFCLVFLSTSILGTVFLIPLVSRKGCNRFYWVRLFSLVYTWWTRFLRVSGLKSGYQG